MMEEAKGTSPILLEDLGRRYANENSKSKIRYGLYKCGYCGKEFKGNTANIKSGTAKSCGCLKGEAHGLKKHRFYGTWQQMVRRCTNVNQWNFKYYGARGVKICDAWLNIKNFVEWADSTYIEGCTLDRIDVDGNYEPSNCRWSDRSTQRVNQRTSPKSNSGFIGVYKVKDSYQATVQLNKKPTHLGTFKTIEEAVGARDNYIIENNLPHKLSKDYIKKEENE